MTKLIEPERDARQDHAACAAADDRPIWQVIDELMRDVPEEILHQSPADGAEQHDHYLYGAPKRTPQAS